MKLCKRLEAEDDVSLYLLVDPGPLANPDEKNRLAGADPSEGQVRRAWDLLPRDHRKI